jgi:hypothetical protein
MKSAGKTTGCKSGSHQLHRSWPLFENNAVFLLQFKHCSTANLLSAITYSISAEISLYGLSQTWPLKVVAQQPSLS